MENFLIIHIDGLSYFSLQEALKKGRMPFLSSLLKDGYTTSPYHSGLPSTTPYVQAGILYGDNTNIPSFRWYDRQEKVVVQFGIQSSFNKVANKYFKNCTPLLKDGTAIGACFSGGASETFGVLYKDTILAKHYINHNETFKYWRFLLSPKATVKWIFYAARTLIELNWQHFLAQVQRKPVASKYVFSELLHEIFWHLISLYAVKLALHKGIPKIFVGLYAFDELAHAFGPKSRFAFHTLNEIDRSISSLAKFIKKEGQPHEIIIYSDHGQAQTTAYTIAFNKTFGQTLSTTFPNFDIEEHHGANFKATNSKKGKLILTYSGGLGHLYFEGEKIRLSQQEINNRFPQFLNTLSDLPGVGFLMLKDGKKDLLYVQNQIVNLDTLDLKTLKKLVPNHPPLEQVKSDLKRLNSFPASGDIIIFSAYQNGLQLNFENQVGAHGCLDIEQSTPFFLLPKQFSKNIPKTIIDLHNQLLSK